MLEHIDRLRCFQALELPEGIGRNIHQNRLLKIAREGALTPHSTTVPDEAQRLIDQTSQLIP